MSMQVRRAPNGSAVRFEHWFATMAAVAFLLACAWAALAGAAELGAVLTHWTIVRYARLEDVLAPLLHPRDPAASLPADARDAMPPPPVLWTLAGIVFASLAVPATAVILRIARWMAPSDRYRGQATSRQLQPVAGETALRRLAIRVRPTVDPRSAAVAELGIRIGETARAGEPVHMSFQNNLGLVAGPQTGKTTSTMGVVPLVFPGPAIMTETHRPDVLAMSACQPDFRRPVLVLDPENRIGWPRPIGIDVLDGCEDHAVAYRRANLLIRAATTRSETAAGNMEFFIGEATSAATAFLHAARIGNRPLDEVLRWTQRWGSSMPIDILEAHRGSDAAQSDAEMLRQLYGVTGPQAAGTAGELRNALGCLADPGVVNAFSGRVGPTLDIKTFLRDRGRLYVHGSGREQRSIAPFVALVITEIVEEALTQATRTEHRRLDPPLLLDLDEVANIAPLPELPYYLSAGAGSGVCTIWAAQGRAQLRRRWGVDAAREIWQSTNFRVWFGGSAEVEELRELEELSGKVWEETVNEQRPNWTEWLFSRYGDRYGRHRGMQRVPVFTADQLRTLPDEHAVLFARNLPPVELRMRPWWQRRDIADLVRASQRTFQSIVQRGAIA